MKQLITIYRDILSSKGIKQTVITTFGTYFAALLSALSIILISRNLGPTIFGEFSAAFSLSIVIAKLNDAGITIATQKFASQSANKKETKSFIYLGYKLKIILSLIIVGCSLLFTSQLTQLFKFSHPLIVPISLILGISVTYYDHLTVTLLATHSFIKASLVNISQAGFKLLSAVSITFFYPNKLIPLLALFLFAPGFPLLFKNYFEPHWFKKIQTLEINKIKKEKFIHLSKHSAILVFASGVIDYIGVLFVKNYMTSYEAGLLGGISRIALLFSLIGISLSQVLYNRVSRYTKQSDLDAFITKVYILTLGIGCIYLAILPMLSVITKVTIGTEYLVALEPLRVLVASVFIYIVTIPFAALFYSFDKDSYFSVSGIIQLLSLFIGNYLLVPSYGITGSAYAQLLSRLVILAFTISFAYISYKEKYGDEK